MLAAALRPITTGRHVRHSLISAGLMSQSSSSPLVITSFNDETKVATMTMNRSPVNSLSMEMCQAISTEIREIESNRRTQALILTSSNKVFSAGLDLTELHQPQPQRLADFWTAFQQLFLDLYGTRLATIACVSGPAIAGGCMLAMACDYRIMKSSQSAVIGLNEAQFGIVAPPWMADLMVLTVGHRHAEKALMLGLLFDAQHALDIGLIDEIVSDNILEACHHEAIRWTQIPPDSRVASKQKLRRPLLNSLANHREHDMDLFREIIVSDKVQTNLGHYMESLKKK